MSQRTAGINGKRLFIFGYGLIKNLSKLTSDKVIQEIKHIDDDACIQITFSDNSYTPNCYVSGHHRA